MENNEAGRVSKKQRLEPFDKDVVYKLYFKGLVSNEIAAENNATTAGFGVAICDQTDKLLFEMKESVSDAEINREGAEIGALIRGLSKSFDLGIRSVVIYCEDDQIYQYVSDKCKPKEKEIIELIEQVYRLKEKFASSESNVVARDDNKFAFKLASKALGSRTDDRQLSDDGHGHGHDHDDDGHGHDHDEEDDNPWAYGCGCDFDLPDSPPGFDVAAYIEYYSL